MNSRIKYIRLTDWNQEDASIILRLMMLVNDIAMSSRLRHLVVQASTKNTREFDEGTEQYILRLNTSQVLEALSILPELKSNNRMNIILNNNKAAQRAYQRLLEYRDGGKYEKEWQVLAKIRNNGMFHYKSVGKLLTRAMTKRIKDGITTGKIIWTDEKTTPARFVVADELHQMVFTYDLLGHYDGKDFNEALKESVNLLNNVHADFAKLAVTIIYKGIEDRYR